MQLDFRTPPGFDRTRNVEIGNKNFDLTYLEEAYTTEHWLVRIYKVKDLVNRLKSDNVHKIPIRKTTSKKVMYTTLRINPIEMGVLPFGPNLNCVFDQNYCRVLCAGP